MFELGSGWPMTPPELGESAGQSRATNVCQPKFSQSSWVTDEGGGAGGFGGGLTMSTGTLGLKVTVDVAVAFRRVDARTDRWLPVTTMATKATAQRTAMATMARILFMGFSSSFSSATLMLTRISFLTTKTAP